MTFVVESARFWVVREFTFVYLASALGPPSVFFAFFYWEEFFDLSWNLDVIHRVKS